MKETHSLPKNSKKQNETFQVVLLPRFRPGWPPPGAYDADGPSPSVPGLGAPRPPLPTLLPHGTPICAATVRSSLGYLEVPFFATQESRRNR